MFFLENSSSDTGIEYCCDISNVEANASHDSIAQSLSDVRGTSIQEIDRYNSTFRNDKVTAAVVTPRANFHDYSFANSSTSSTSRNSFGNETGKLL